MTYDYDLFVIGAGSGGVRAARIAAAHGARVAVAEEFRIGGTCVIRGCVPKKLLVYGAHFAEDLDDARRFGWTLGEHRFDWSVLRDNVLADVDRLNALYVATLATHKVDQILARATLAGSNAVHVDGRTVSARHILIATGGHPTVPDIPGAEHGITSNEVFHLPALPKRMVIAGGGYIANEFAGIFHEFGTQVTLINRGDRILRGWETALVDRLLSISIAKGIAFRFNSMIERIEKLEDSSLRLWYKDGTSQDTDVLMWAIGRMPSIAGLGLEAAGVIVNDRGAIAVDADSHTNIPSIHAVGDVTDRIQLTPIAIREGHALADGLFGNKAWRVDHACVPSAVFSNPPLASVGLTEAEAVASGNAVRIYTSDFRPMRNVLAGRDERALYKLVIDATSDVVIGAHMLGPDSPEILQALAIAVKARLTKAQLDETVALHPTMSEELVLMRQS